MSKQICDEINQAYLEDFRQRDFAELGLDKPKLVWFVVESNYDGRWEFEIVQYPSNFIEPDGSIFIEGERYLPDPNDPIFFRQEVGDA